MVYNPDEGKRTAEEFIVVALCAMGFLLIYALASCTSTPSGPQGPTVKVYTSAPNRPGAYRGQTGEVVPYSQTQGWMMMSPTDFEALVGYCGRKEPATSSDMAVPAPPEAPATELQP